MHSRLVVTKNHAAANSPPGPGAIVSHHGGRRASAAWFADASFRDAPGGGASFGYMRLCHRPPRSNPTTLADHTALRLVGFLEHDHLGDLLQSETYTKLLPSRLEKSIALRDAVSVYVSAWTNFQRGEPAEKVVPPVEFGRALRSLQLALDSPDTQLSSETLAATTMMERLESEFDRNRLMYQTVHLDGVRSLMLRRGPPKLNDELDVCLALENHFPVVGLTSRVALSFVPS